MGKSALHRHLLRYHLHFHLTHSHTAHRHTQTQPQTHSTHRKEVHSMTRKDLEKAGYTEHHVSWKRGYMSRKSPERVYPYKGRFGEGYCVESPAWTSTQYHFITYYIKK